MTDAAVVTTVHSCKFTGEADKYIQDLAAEMGMSYIDTLKKVIENGLKETTLAQRIVEAVKREIEAREYMEKKCAEKGEVDLEMHYCQDKHVMMTVLAVIEQVIRQ